MSPGEDTMTITIHGIARSRAIRNIWAAEEAGIPYVHDPVDFSDTGIRSAAFKAVNPMAQIPALTDGGLVLTESLAINLYLAKKAGGALAPRDLAEEGRMLQWTLFAATQLEPHTLEIMYNRATKPEAERDERKVVAGIEALQRPLGVLDGALADGSLVGGRFTVADLNVACALMYLRFTPEVIAAFPNVARFWEAVKARPAYRRAWALRGE